MSKKKEKEKKTDPEDIKEFKKFYKKYGANTASELLEREILVENLKEDEEEFEK